MVLVPIHKQERGQLNTDFEDTLSRVVQSWDLFRK